MSCLAFFMARWIRFAKKHPTKNNCRRLCHPKNPWDVMGCHGVSSCHLFSGPRNVMNGGSGVSIGGETEFLGHLKTLPPRTKKRKEFEKQTKCFVGILQICSLFLLSSFTPCFLSAMFFNAQPDGPSWIQASSNSTWEGDLGGESLTARGW